MNVQSMFSRNLRFIVALAICAGVALVAVATSASLTHADDARPEPVQPPLSALYPPPASQADAAAGHAAFADRFALLRDADTVVLASVVIRDPGVDRTAARPVAVASEQALAQAGASSPRSQAWIAPRYDGDECILVLAQGADGPGEVCNSADGAADGYLLAAQSRSDEDVELYGLVPDGVERVVVTLRDRSRHALPVVGNAYAARFAQPTAAVAFADASGAEREIPIRSDG